MNRIQLHELLNGLHPDLVVLIGTSETGTFHKICSDKVKNITSDRILGYQRCNVDEIRCLQNGVMVIELD